MRAVYHRVWDRALHVDAVIQESATAFLAD